MAKKKSKPRNKRLSSSAMLKLWRRKRIRVEISYRGGEWSKVDEDLRRLARKYKGRLLGSGMVMSVGVRDTSFDFGWPEFGGSAMQMLANVRVARPILTDISKKVLPGVVSFLIEAEKLKVEYPKMEIRCAITFYL